MTYKKLFSQGCNYTDYIAEGSVAEQQAVNQIEKQLALINLPEQTKSKLAQLNKPIYLLVVGEMWCPDCQINIAAINYLQSLNKNIELAIISKEQAEKSLVNVLAIEAIKIPLVIVLDGHYNKLGVFTERPVTVARHEDFKTIKPDYRAGHYLLDTIIEISDKFPS